MAGNDEAALEELRATLKSQTDLEVHPADAAMLADDKYLRRYLTQHDGDLAGAKEMLIGSLKWRNSFGANDLLSETSLNLDHLRAGLFYPRGKDVDGFPILVFRSKKHVKGQRDFDEVMKCVVYWFERMARRDGAEKFSVFFDMTDCGLSHMDMEFTRYLIDLFKFYYPDYLNYIIIFEMPWILSAAFKIIKGLLPAKAASKLKFITKSNITTYVPTEHVHTSWGGPDDYEFAFVSLQDSPTNDTISKKVTFADPGTPDREHADENTRTTLISLNPRNLIVFKKEGEDIIGGFTVTNNRKGPVAYKVRTTAPEKIKVSPNSGVLTVGGSISIKIILYSTIANVAATIPSIKFLVACTAVDKDHLTTQEMADLWKNDSNKMEQHRLRCSGSELTNARPELKLFDDTVAQSSDSQKQASYLTKTVSDLKANNDALNSQMKTLKTIQLINLALSAVLLYLIIYFFRNIQFPERCSEFYTSP